MALHCISGSSSLLELTPRRSSSPTVCRRKAAALSHLILSISTPQAEAMPGSTSACSSGLPGWVVGVSGVCGAVVVGVQ